MLSELVATAVNSSGRSTHCGPSVLWYVAEVSAPQELRTELKGAKGDCPYPTLSPPSSHIKGNISSSLEK